ncbi:MAG: TatD family hydrolase [Flavipsychrobacter sp.]
MYIDTHTHIYDEQFDVDRTQMLERAFDVDVKKLYMPNCNSQTIEGMMKLAKEYPDNCYPMMGLHPCYVKEDYKEELEIVSSWLKKERFSAVGEIGLDYHWDLTFKEQQIEAFNQQIDLALQYDLPIVIHSRSSTQDCIDIVKQRQNGNLKGIFHCFGDTIKEAQQIIDLGLHIGIGGVATFKNSKLSEVIKQVDIKHIVLETDAPYLAPTPYRGKRNECSYIPLIAEKIGDIKGISAKEIGNITTQNALNIFSS